MVNKFFSLMKPAVAARLLSGALPVVVSLAFTPLVFAPAAMAQESYPQIKAAPVAVPSGVSVHHPDLRAVKPRQGMETRNKGSETIKDAILRSKNFIYHFTKPENGSGEVIVLLHGSGGNEASLVPFAQQVWPRATLLGIRGRIQQEGRTRWYARITPVQFDQNDVRAEAEAFVSFLTKLSDEDRIDLSRSTFVGYSNGANLLAATMMLHPDLVKKAVLMRSMPVLDQTPAANLSKAKVLVVTGSEDKMYAPFAPALSGLLRNSGAKVDARVVQAGHMIGAKDVALVSAWLSGQGVDGAPALSQVLKQDQH